MARREIPFIVTKEGRDKGKEFIITEMSAWDADTLSQDIFRAMGDSNFNGIPIDVVAMGSAGLATLGLSVLSAASPETAHMIREKLIATVDIVINDEGRRTRRKVNGPLDFDEVSTIRDVMDQVFKINFDFLTRAEG